MGYIMQPPDEIMTQDFLPSMRQLVALRLRAEGFSQNRISSLLGITQASVSLYLSSRAEKAYSALSALSVSRSQADGYASLLSSAVKKGASEGVTTLHTIWTNLLGKGSICPVHRDLYPALFDCDICIKSYGGRNGARAQAVSEVSEAVKMLEGSPNFAAVMPEVSVNIACAAGDATTPADVIAVPGRIVRVKDKAKAMLPPEPGASAHMSKVLLLVMRRHPQLRACVNVRYDRRMARAMKKTHLQALSIGGYSLPGAADPTAEALEGRLKSASGTFNAVVDEGGNGVEPNLYLFAKGAREVAGIALRLAEYYSAA